MEQHSRRLLSPEDAVAVDVEVGRAPPRQLWAKAREGRFGKDGKQGGRRGGRRGRNFEMRKPRAGDWERIKQLFRYMRSERARLLLGSALMIFGSLLGLSTPSLFGEILDLLHTGDGGQEPELRALSGALVGVIFSTACVGALQRYLFATAGERLVNNLKSKLFDAMLSREIAFFDANDSGALLSRITDDASRLRGLMTRTWPAAAKSVVSVLTMVAYQLYLSWSLTLVTLAVVPALAFGAKVYGKRVRKLGKQAQDGLAQATALAGECLSNVRTVRAFGQEAPSVRRFEREVVDAYERRRSYARLSSLFRLGMGTATALAAGGVAYMGGSQVLSGALTVGTFTSYLFYTAAVGRELSSLTGTYGDVMGRSGRPNGSLSSSLRAARAAAPHLPRTRRTRRWTRHGRTSLSRTTPRGRGGCLAR